MTGLKVCYKLNFNSCHGELHVRPCFWRFSESKDFVMLFHFSFSKRGENTEKASQRGLSDISSLVPCVVFITQLGERHQAANDAVGVSAAKHALFLSSSGFHCTLSSKFKFKKHRKFLLSKLPDTCNWFKDFCNHELKLGKWLRSAQQEVIIQWGNDSTRINSERTYSETSKAILS